MECQAILIKFLVPQSDDIEDLSMADESFSSDEETAEDEPHEVDEEAIRRASIEESIKKIRELEKDRPMWEEAARKRQAAAEAEERAKWEAKQQEELKQKRQAEAEEQRKRDETARKAREEAERQREAETAKANIEKRRTQLRNNIMRKVNAQKAENRGRWTSQNSVMWYREQCDVFDKTKFRSADAVVAFESIPWPTTSCPGAFKPEDITWESTESFFERARQYMTWEEYLKCVEKSVVRFHPDRWTARGVLLTIADANDVERYKAAAIRAAKAINDLNSKLKDR